MTLHDLFPREKFPLRAETEVKIRKDVTRKDMTEKLPDLTIEFRVFYKRPIEQTTGFWVHLRVISPEGSLLMESALMMKEDGVNHFWSFGNDFIEIPQEEFVLRAVCVLTRGKSIEEVPTMAQELESLKNGNSELLPALVGAYQGMVYGLLYPLGYTAPWKQF